MSRLDSLAMAILQGLMLRHEDDGYSDEGAIHEAYRLAEHIITAKPQKTISNSEYLQCSECGTYQLCKLAGRELKVCDSFSSGQPKEV